MKGMPLPFDFQGKGVLDLELVENNKTFFTDFGGGGGGGGAAAVSSFFFKKFCFLNGGFGEPTSVLDSARTPSRPTSSSTLSSSLGGGGGSTAGGGGAASTDTAGVAAAVSDTKWQQQDSTTATSSNAGRPDSGLLSVPPPLQIGTATAACGGANPEKFAMEDWESVLSESVAVSPSQEQSILRLIMGDVEDPAMGSSLNKVLQIGGAAASEFEFSDGFGVVDQGFCGGGGGDQFGSSFMPALPSFPNNNSNHRSSNLPTTNFKFSPNETLPLHHHHHHHHQTQFDSPPEMKPPIFNPNLLLNHHSQNPSFFFPLSYPHQDNNNTIFAAPPHPKRHNSGSGGSPLAGAITDTGQQELFMSQQHMQHQTHQLPHQLQLLPNHYQQKPKTTDCGGGGGAAMVDELGQQQAVVDQLYKAAELVQTGNLVLAQGILARLNHHLSPIGKPFHRAAFYFKESLQLLLHQNNNNNSSSSSSPFALVFKIGAYKSFSEISPLVQFSNFTCNQAILENLEGSNRIHIVDFDIGYGGQWASLMQELALRGGGGGGPPSLKITAFASHLTPHDQLELSLTQENLIQFASEINISFEFEVVSIDSLNSGSWARSNDNEAVAVNLPVGFLANCQMWVPLILRFVKHLSPRIVVSVDRGCDRTDLPFANHVIHALQSYSNMLESLDAVNVNIDALQKIERFLIHPGIEKIVTGRFSSQEKTQHWRALFLSSGFSPVAFSNFAESQAECVVKRTPVRGFQVEKRQSALVLCWQRKELVSASAWRC
ncbi:hypothetical protein ABFS82_02G147300 [Erythranthe guttata]